MRQGAAARFKPVRTGRWWDSTATNEIDIVATDAHARVLVAECKWGQIDSHDLGRLRERAVSMVREMKEVSTIKYVLFSRRPPTDEALLREIESGEVTWFDAAALFK